MHSSIRFPIYLDYCATTPCDPAVVEAMLPCFSENFGNPSSKDHFFGWAATELVDQARAEIAGLVGASPHQLIFTSGATESLNTVLKGLAKAPGKGHHFITCHTEHNAVLQTCKRLEASGTQVTYLGVDEAGHIDMGELESAIRPATKAIILMYGNNETGTIHEVDQIGALARKHQVLFVCDATQAVGKVAVDVTGMQVDFMAFSAHKLYGPKGIGALFIKDPKAHQHVTLLHGGGQEKDFRSGTLNVPSIVGFGKAASLCKRGLEEEQLRLNLLKEKLEKGLLENIPGAHINGSTKRLPHITNVSIPHQLAEKLLLALSAKLAMSRGSACHNISEKPSHVLMAMGISEETALQSIRISLGRFTSEEEVATAVRLLAEYCRIPSPLSGAIK